MPRRLAPDHERADDVDVEDAAKEFGRGVEDVAVGGDPSRIDHAVEAAVGQAQQAAGKGDVLVAGGASVIQQALRAGLVDEFQLHVAPVLLGGRTPLFAGLGPDDVQVETVRVVESPSVTHLKYHVVR